MATQEEEEEVAQGSPSPAPRLWRSRTTPGEKKFQKSPSKGSPKQGWRRRGTRSTTEQLGRDDGMSSVESFESVSQHSEVSESDIDQKLKQFEKDQLRRGQTEGKNTLFSTQKLGPKVSETGAQLSRKASNSTLDRASPSRGYQPWGVKATSSRGWLKRMMASPDTSDGNQESGGQPPVGRDMQTGRRASSPSGVLGKQSPPPTPTSNAFPDSHNPNRSFAWQADEDFTAGDLQASESPPVKAGLSNNQLDEIEATESDAHERAFASNRSKSRNTKLDEIRALEIEAALKFPDETPGRSDEKDEIQGKCFEDEDRSRQARHIGRTNTRIDEIRAREIETLSRRALATARLDEIRELNAEFGSRSRSSSPELTRKPGPELPAKHATSGDGIQGKDGDSKPEDDGEQIPNTPITVFKKPGSVPAANAGEGATRRASSSWERPVPRNDSHDLLRLLARAASNSPASEQQVALEGDAKDDAQRAVTGLEKSDSGDSGKERRLDRTADDPKPRVGFAGLRREPSIESTSDKRSSLSLSDIDPTERIERELQLFAPAENHSERGSLRAPSPDLEDECLEETPRPARPDPLTLPTPKVTGAYVETPVTIKAERVEDVPLPQIVEPEQAKATSGIYSLSRGRTAEPSTRRLVQSRSAKGGRETTRPTSLPTGRRSRSVPRAQSPLMNSARPPTVKDDLLEIHRAHQIEDSTLDDFSELFAGQVATSPQAEEELKPEESVKIDESVLEEILSRDKELERYARMSKALKSGLHDIRTAKRGIERLEDKVSHAETRPKSEEIKSEETRSAHAAHASHDNCPVCLAHPPSSNNMVAYVHLPLPRLWRRQPRFKFTLLGLVIFLLSFWYVAESTMCFFYCKPDSCYPGQPCDWSHDDPFWGYSIPVKLDQWTTGGSGRTLASRWGPDIADWRADLWDAVTGTDFTRADTSNFNWDQRRQHRRRLMKRGLIKPAVERPEDKAKHEAWRAAAAAKERADAMREMGYDAGDEESMRGDEKVSSR